jgi:hypothetical protein
MALANAGHARAHTPTHAALDGSLAWAAAAKASEKARDGAVGCWAGLGMGCSAAKQTPPRAALCVVAPMSSSPDGRHVNQGLPWTLFHPKQSHHIDAVL